MLKHNSAKPCAPLLSVDWITLLHTGGRRFSGGALCHTCNILRDIDIGTALECCDRCNHD